MKIRLLIFLFLFKIFSGHSQYLPKEYFLVDSLEEEKIGAEDLRLLKSYLNSYHKLAKDDTSRLSVVSLLIERLVDETIWIKYNRLLLQATQEKQVGQQGRVLYVYKGLEANALNNFGYYYVNYTMDSEAAVKYYKQAVKISESIEKYDSQVTCYANIANFYQNTGDLMQALDWYNKALSLESKVPKKSTFIAPLNNLAQVHLYLGDTSNALLSLKKCFLFSHDQMDKGLKAHLLHNIGIISYRNGERGGLQSVKNALALRKQLGDKKGIVQSCIGLAGIYKTNGNVSMAMEYIKDAELNLQGQNNPHLEALFYSTRGNILKDKDRLGAIKNYEKSAAIYKQLNGGVELAALLEGLIALYGNEAAYIRKKLEAYDLLAEVNKRINKTNLQKLLMKQKYDERLKMQQAMFKAEEFIREEKNSSEKRKQRLYLLGITVILLLTIGFATAIFLAFKKIRKNNRIISEQKLEVEKQKQLVEEKHKDITDSINYAQRIQSALIVSEQKLNNSLREAFVIFQPRDVVSGDFYWFSEKDGKKIVALADCTGHGVPGAFMSMIGITLLNQIVNEKGIISPGQILNKLRKEVISALSTDTQGKQDGMDMAVICFDDQELCYAGANSQLILFCDGCIRELKPNKQPIGNYERQDDFTEHRVSITPGLTAYLFSDGIVDQFGGPLGKKLKTKQFRSWIVNGAGESLPEQKNRIVQQLESWKAGFDQTDDISLIGLRLA